MLLATSPTSWQGMTTMTDFNSERPGKRRGRRRGQRRARAANPPVVQDDRGPAQPTLRRPSHHPRTVHEYSAGGLVIARLDDPADTQVAVLIGHIDHRGRTRWTIPKGHIEVGETAEQTAVREIEEETGIRGEVLAALGSISYWFSAENRRVRKTVHHYLLRYRNGEPAYNDHEAGEVAWVPLQELSAWLVHADERRLAKVAAELVDTLRRDGPAALPPRPYSPPRKRPQTHSIARRRPADPQRCGDDNAGKD
jgi:mutator protein MutT